MAIPIRKSFAILLLCVALVPAGMVAVFTFGSPSFVYSTAATGSLWLSRFLWGLVIAFGVGLVAYPPFLPLLRLKVGNTWRRLGTDKGPLEEAIGRLHHLETHADRLLVGRMARQLGNLPLAAENLSRAFEMDPSHLAGRYQLGVLLATTNRLADAVNVLFSVVSEDEKHAFGDALFHLGRSLFRMHRDAEAISILRRHQAVFPGSRQVHLLVARVLADAGEMEQAKAELSLAARPADEKEHLSPEENLARARAKVTFLRKGRGMTNASSPTEDDSDETQPGQP